MSSIILSVSIALLYNLIIGRVEGYVTDNSTYDEKSENVILIEIISGIVALALGYLVFKNNNTVKYGLMLGGSLLLISGLICNWNRVQNGTKMFFMVSTLIMLILYCYKK